MRIHQKYANEIIFPVVSLQAANTRASKSIESDLDPLWKQRPNTKFIDHFLSPNQTAGLEIHYGVAGRITCNFPSDGDGKFVVS